MYNIEVESVAGYSRSRCDLSYFIRVGLLPIEIRPIYWDEVEFEPITKDDYIGVDLFSEGFIYIPEWAYVDGGGVISLDKLIEDYCVISKGSKLVIDMKPS